MAVERVAGVRSDRVFFTGMSLIAALTVFAGFAPTYYLRSPDLPSLPTLVYLHGMVFTSWILLFVAQTTLVAAHRTDIHRRLGIVAAVVACLAVVVGTTVAIRSLKAGFGPIIGFEPSTFFSIPMADILSFTILVSAGIVLRRQADAHKRLMLLGTITLLNAAFARLAFPLSGGVAGVVSAFVFGDLLVAACVFYDFWSRGRVHPSLVTGGLLLVAGKPLLVMASGTPVWLAFVNALR
jgi:hypothetical protein